jgi:hypothetical protein
VPRLIKIDFYKTEDSDGNALDITDFITRTFGLAIADRQVDYGNSFLQLHNVRDHGGLLLGEILKTKMTDPPDKVSKTTGVPAELGLRADEGIGHHGHFLYDGHRCALLLQRDREVRHPAFREGVGSPIHEEFNLSLIFKPDALERLNRMQVIRKLSFRVARPQNPEAFREIDPSAERAIELLNEHGGLLIDVNISVGKRREASLARETVLRFARGLLGHGGEDVRKVVVSGREDNDASIEIIDLFEDRLIYEAPADYRGRAIDPRSCERILLEAHQEYAGYLQNYRHAE